ADPRPRWARRLPGTRKTSTPPTRHSARGAATETKDANRWTWKSCGMKTRSKSGKRGRADGAAGPSVCGERPDHRFEAIGKNVFTGIVVGSGEHLQSALPAEREQAAVGCHAQRMREPWQRVFAHEHRCFGIGDV